jgi:hypothetical protein
LESSLNRITPHRLHQYDNAQNTKKILPISIFLTNYTEAEIILA